MDSPSDWREPWNAIRIFAALSLPMMEKKRVREPRAFALNLAASMRSAVVLLGVIEPPSIQA